MTLIHGIDPGQTKGAPGHCVLSVDIAPPGVDHAPDRIVWLAQDPYPHPVDIAVSETQWCHGVAGKKALITLGSDTGFRLAHCPAERHFRIEPDAWRKALWGDRAHGKPKPWCLHWLRVRLAPLVPGVDVEAVSDDAVEAFGVALAMAELLRAEKPLSKVAGLKRMQVKTFGGRWV